MKGKAYATTLSDSESSNLDSEDSCDEEENFSKFITIAHVESSEDLNLLVQELGEHSDEESMGIVEESNAKVDEMLNGELTKAYTKVKFLEFEVVQANAKIDRVPTKKLDDVISSQKTFSNKIGLGYTGERSTSVKVTKEVKFVKAKESKGFVPTVEKANVEEKKNMANQRVLNKPRNQSTVRTEAKKRSPPN